MKKYLIMASLFAIGLAIPVVNSPVIKAEDQTQTAPSSNLSTMPEVEAKATAEIVNEFVGGGYNLPSDGAGEYQPVAPAKPAAPIVFVDNGKAPELKPIDIVPDSSINLEADGNGEFAMPV